VNVSCGFFVPTVVDDVIEALAQAAGVAIDPRSLIYAPLIAHLRTRREAKAALAKDPGDIKSGFWALGSGLFAFALRRTYVPRRKAHLKAILFQ
jgi:hypothetical protein